MEAYSTPTGWEGVPAPSRKLITARRICWRLQEQIKCFEEVLAVAQAQQQRAVIPWLKEQLEAYRCLLTSESKKLAKLK